MGGKIRLVGGKDFPESNRRPAPDPNRQPTARGENLLTDKAIAKWVREGMKKPLRDGAALYLVGGQRGPVWRIDYRRPADRKENTYTVGSYGQGADEFTLAQARKERDTVRDWLKTGLDPNVEKKAQKARTIAAQGMTFEKLANEWFAKAKLEWTSKKHIAGRRTTLDKDLLATLGSLPVADLEASPPTALAALQRIEERGAYEMVAKARVVGSMICRYGIVTNRMKSDPFAHLGAALKRPPVVNRATVGGADMPGLFEALSKVPAELNTKLALYFQIATAVRPGEVRFAPWKEIDGDVWRIPAERMKMRSPFVQPLSPLALKILERARDLRQTGKPDELIFPGFTRHGALSENAFTSLLARCGFFGRQTAHGFRAAFSTWAHEQHEADPDVIEACLAHVKEGVRGIYNRAAYLTRRRELLKAWGEQLEAWGLLLP